MEMVQNINLAFSSCFPNLSCVIFIPLYSLFRWLIETRRDHVYETYSVPFMFEKFILEY